MEQVRDDSMLPKLLIQDLEPHTEPIKWAVYGNCDLLIPVVGELKIVDYVEGAGTYEHKNIFDFPYDCIYDGIKGHLLYFSYADKDDSIVYGRAYKVSISNLCYKFDETYDILV